MLSLHFWEEAEPLPCCVVCEELQSGPLHAVPDGRYASEGNDERPSAEGLQVGKEGEKEETGRESGREGGNGRGGKGGKNRASCDDVLSFSLSLSAV